MPDSSMYYFSSLFHCENNLLNKKWKTFSESETYRTSYEYICLRHPRSFHKSQKKEKNIVLVNFKNRSWKIDECMYKFHKFLKDLLYVAVSFIAKKIWWEVIWRRYQLWLSNCQTTYPSDINSFSILAVSFIRFKSYFKWKMYHC